LTDDVCGFYFSRDWSGELTPNGFKPANDWPFPSAADSPRSPLPAPPRLFFSVGPARCGKSTYARRWEEGFEMPEVLGHRVRWSQDSLRIGLHGRRYNKHLEPLVHGLKPAILKAHLDMGHVVFVDGTHTTARSIKQLLEVDVNAVPVLFDVPAEICIARAHATGQPDLVPVIERHCRNVRELLGGRPIDEVMDRLRRETREELDYRWKKYDV